MTLWFVAREEAIEEGGGREDSVNLFDGLFGFEFNCMVLE